MALRFRKSITICKGVRVNVTKKGVGIGVGVNGARMSMHSTGSKSASVGIPGTGLYYYTSSGGGNRTNRKAGNGSATANVNKTVVHESGTVYTYTPEDVSRFKLLIQMLTESFKECSPTLDWEQIKTSKPPFEKGTRGPEELNAIKEYNSLKPTFAEKLAKAKFEQRKVIAYEEIAKSKVRDTENYAAWEALVECADKVLNGDIDSYYDAINAYDPFVELSKLGSDFEFGTDDSRLMEIEFCTKFDETIPHEKLTLTPAGKVSYKNMSKTEMYDITQDYVCSLAIRLAREVFALIPVDTVIVHADENSKDTFGNDARHTILSVKFERAVFEKTNFDYIDASDFVATFIHNQKFLKTQGFRPIERLTTQSVDVRIIPTEGSIVGRKTTETKINFSKIEYPWGWYTENEAFLKPRDTEMCRLIKKGFNSESIDEKIEGIKGLLSYAQEYKEECIQKGLLFEKYFYEGYMSEGGKIKDKTKQWRKELEELEENYLDVKEAESAIAQAKETMKDDLEKLIKENPGILQKDLYSHFSKHVKHLLLEELYKLQLEGKLKKEKSGNSNKLWIE